VRVPDPLVRQLPCVGKRDRRHRSYFGSLRRFVAPVRRRWSHRP
jgi:hypothetical protein